MTADELLRQVRSLGVRVSVVGDRLRFEGATQRLSLDLRRLLAEHKAELLPLVAGQAPGPSPETDDPHEETEQNEETPAGHGDHADGGPAPDRAVVLEQVRQRVSPALRRWDDDLLLALVLWHLAVAFDRGGEPGWRRYLPPVLEGLTDDEIETLVDWPALQAMEHTHWRTNADGAMTLHRGGMWLAAWWDARRDTERTRTTRAGRPAD